jgi:glycerophosphoryl diester phosphodiesterase
MLDQVIFRIDDPYETFAEKHGDRMGEMNYMPLLWWNTEDPAAFVDGYLHAPHPPRVIEVLFGEDRTDLLDHVDRIRSRGIGIMMNPIYPHIAAGRLDDLALSDPDGNWGWVIERGATVIGTDRPVLLMNYLEESQRRF